MDTRSDVLDWLRAHPRDIHGDASDIIESCEREVRRHAAADAWLSARDYADSQRDLWEHRFGYPISSSSFVAREMCALYARALRKHKPEVAEGTERHLAGDDVVAALEPIAWDEMRPWIRALAQREEDVVWKQVIRFTRRCAHNTAGAASGHGVGLGHLRRNIRPRRRRSLGTADARVRSHGTRRGDLQPTQPVEDPCTAPVSLATVPKLTSLRRCVR